MRLLERDLRAFLGGAFPALEEKQLAEAISDFIKYQNSEQIGVETLIDLQVTLESALQRLLFRVFSKCFANSVKHAQAKRAKVLLVANQRRVTLMIRDDGRGFRVPADWGEEACRGHFGLWSAQRDVKAHGGTMTVSSQPGQGTTVMVQFSSAHRFRWLILERFKRGVR